VAGTEEAATRRPESRPDGARLAGVRHQADLVDGQNHGTGRFAAATGTVSSFGVSGVDVVAWSGTITY